METMVRRKNASAMPRRPRPKPTSAKIRSEERRRNAQPRDVAVGVHDRQNDGNDGPEEKRLRHAAKTATQADERENQIGRATAKCAATGCSGRRTRSTERWKRWSGGKTPPPCREDRDPSRRARKSGQFRGYS